MFLLVRNQLTKIRPQVRLLVGDNSLPILVTERARSTYLLSTNSHELLAEEAAQVLEHPATGRGYVQVFSSPAR